MAATPENFPAVNLALDAIEIAETLQFTGIDLESGARLSIRIEHLKAAPDALLKIMEPDMVAVLSLTIGLVPLTF